MIFKKQSVFPTMFCALCSLAQAQNQGILDGFGWEGTLKPIPALPGAGTLSTVLGGSKEEKREGRGGEGREWKGRDEFGSCLWSCLGPQGVWDLGQTLCVSCSSACGKLH